MAGCDIEHGEALALFAALEIDVGRVRLDERDPLRIRRPIPAESLSDPLRRAAVGPARAESSQRRPVGANDPQVEARVGTAATRPVVRLLLIGHQAAVGRPGGQFVVVAVAEHNGRCTVEAHSHYRRIDACAVDPLEHEPRAVRRPARRPVDRVSARQLDAIAPVGADRVDHCRVVSCACGRRVGDCVRWRAVGCVRLEVLAGHGAKTAAECHSDQPNAADEVHSGTSASVASREGRVTSAPL